MNLNLSPRLVPFHRQLRLAALAAAVVAAPLGMAATTTGTEFRVNTDTTNAQSPIGVAVAADGGAVVAWTSGSPSGTGLYGQRYANDGTAIGNAFRLDTGNSAASLQTPQSSLAPTPGGFAMAWNGQKLGLSGRQAGVYLRLFAADGAALTDAINVNTANGGNFGFANARVSSDADGNLVVAYTANSRSADSTLSPTVRFQRFNAEGLPQGGEVTVSGSDDSNLAGLSHQPGGGFGVVFSSSSSGQSSLQRYSAEGAPVGERVTLTGVVNGNNPLWLSDSEYLYGEYRQDPTGQGNTTAPHFTLGRYGSDGVLIGERVEVSACGPLYGEGELGLARLADGRLLTAYHCPLDGGTSSSSNPFQQMRAPEGVYLREFSSALVAVGPEVQLNSYINDVQDLPSLGLDASGNGFVVWRSEGQDGSDLGVYARRVALEGGAPVADTTPEAFTFTDVSDAALNTESRSNSITVAGINALAPISVLGGEYSIGCGGNFTSAAGSIGNGATVCVRHTTAGSGRTRTDTTLSIGGISDTFTTVTREDPQGTAADLSLSVTDDPDPVTASTLLSYAVRLRNASAQTASAPDTVVELRLSSAASDFRASADGFVCSGDSQEIRCVKAAGFSGGEQAFLSVLLTAPAQAGSISLTATVIEPRDPVPDNNTQTQTTTINAGGGNTGSGGTVTDPSGRSVAVQLSAGSLENLRAVSTPGSAPVASYGLGFFAFEASAVTPGGSLTVTVTLPSGTAASGLVKCVAGTCAIFPATVNGQTLQFTLVDNGAGDADPTPGQISDPFGVVTSAPTPTTPVVVTTSQGGALNLALLLPLLLLGVRRRTSPMSVGYAAARPAGTLRSSPRRPLAAMNKAHSLCLAGLALAFSASAQETAPTPPPAVSAAEAKEVLKPTNAGSAASIGKLAITSCNVLFGTETSANSETQAGFGEPSQGRVDAFVSSTYELLGVDANALQTMTEAICADAEAQLAARYPVIPAAELAAHPAFQRLHAGGKPTPFALQRADAKYAVYAPAGQSIVDLMYQNSTDTAAGALAMFGSIAKTIASGGGSEADEGVLLSELGASGARINVMVDFAKQKSNKVKGFLGKITGNDSAKVETLLQLSVSGFVRMTPHDKLKTYAGGKVLIDGDQFVRFTTVKPLLANSNAVLAVRDIQSRGSKAGEIGANVLAGAMALSGISTSTTSIERNGVDVDPALYATEVRAQAQRLVAMAAVLAKP